MVQVAIGLLFELQILDTHMKGGGSDWPVDMHVMQMEHGPWTSGHGDWDPGYNGFNLQTSFSLYYKSWVNWKQFSPEGKRTHLSQKTHRLDPPKMERRKTKWRRNRKIKNVSPQNTIFSHPPHPYPPTVPTQSRPLITLGLKFLWVKCTSGP
jgi:hypothetical protein